MYGVHAAELQTPAITKMLQSSGCSVAQGLPEAACGGLASSEQAARLASSMLSATAAALPGLTVWQIGPDCTQNRSLVPLDSTLGGHCPLGSLRAQFGTGGW